MCKKNSEKKNMKTFSMNVGKKKQLIDLNGSSVNFDVNFKLTSSDPFYMVVVNQSTLDENKPIEYKHVTTGEISGNIVSDSGEYDNYFIIIKADNPVQVEVSLDKREVPLNPTTRQSPNVVSEHTPIERIPRVQKRHTPTFWGKYKYVIILIIILIVVGVGYWYYTKYKQNTDTRYRRPKRRSRKLLLDNNNVSVIPQKHPSDLNDILRADEPIVLLPPTDTQEESTVIPPPQSSNANMSDTYVNLPSDLSDVSDM